VFLLEAIPVDRDGSTKAIALTVRNGIFPTRRSGVFMPGMPLISRLPAGNLLNPSLAAPSKWTEQNLGAHRGNAGRMVVPLRLSG
jgi:hypothetical protein